MNIYSSKQEKDNKIMYEIHGGGTSARIFRTWDNQVLKHFMYNDVYKRILATHGGDFLSYLIELSKIDNPSLVISQDVYVRKDKLVTAYKNEYQNGHTLYGIKGNINIDDFLDAVTDFYANIILLENFRLGDHHARNILYSKDKKTGKLILKLIDLDLCRFTDNDEREFNIEKLDSTIFKSLLRIPREQDPYVIDERIKPIYKSFEDHELNVVEFLKEYREFIRNNYGKCETIKQLNRGLIVPESCINNY